MRSFSSLFAAGVFGLTTIASAEAADTARPLKSVAVQNRKYSQTHEFTAWVGTLPLDAFTKGLTGSAGYTLHFNDTIAWEVGQFTYSYGIDTQLNEDLNALSVGPTPFERVRYFASSNVMFKPMYGKQAVLNRGLVYQETFLTAGFSYGWLTITQRPGVNVGVGTRIYGGENFSVRIDIRDTVFFGADDRQNELWLAIGTSLTLR